MDTEGELFNANETPNGLDWAGRGTSHVDFDEEELLPLSQGRFLGHGVNGGVFETEVGERRVAWKRLYCRRQIGPQDLREIDILKKLRSRHIINLIGTYTHGPFLGLLLWPVAVCDLGMFLEDVDELLQTPSLGATGNDDQAPLAERLRSLGIDTPDAASTRLKQCIGCTSSAIEYLHHQSIRHKDIKPSNILLSSAGLWVTDFGTSTDFSSTSQSVTQNGERGTPKYFAPEVAQYEPNGRSADVFSLGCVFLEMIGLCNGYSLEYLKGLRPNKDHSFHANLDSILYWFNFSHINFKSPADQQLMALVREMIARVAQNRPTAVGINRRLRLINTLRRPSPPAPLWGSCCAFDLESSRQIQPRQVTSVTIEIGNTHQLKNLRHKWSFFVRAPAAEAIIAGVHYFLHPSFEYPYTVQHQPPFGISGEGWGYFTISIVIALKQGYWWVYADATLGPEDESLLTLYWTLKFDREFTYSQVEAGITKP